MVFFRFVSEVMAVMIFASAVTGD